MVCTGSSSSSSSHDFKRTLSCTKQQRVLQLVAARDHVDATAQAADPQADKQFNKQIGEQADMQAAASARAPRRHHLMSQGIELLITAATKRFRKQEYDVEPVEK